MNLRGIIITTAVATVGLAAGTALVAKHVLGNEETRQDVKVKAREFGKSASELGRSFLNITRATASNVANEASSIKEEIKEKVKANNVAEETASKETASKESTTDTKKEASKEEVKDSSEEKEGSNAVPGFWEEVYNDKKEEESTDED